MRSHKHKLPDHAVVQSQWCRLIYSLNQIDIQINSNKALFKCEHLRASSLEMSVYVS